MRTIIDAEIRAAFQGWLARHSITLLRVSMGLVIFGFGVLKFFPDVSPAQNLVLAVNHQLTFGLMPDNVTLALFATVESVIGLSLITGWGLRFSVYPLAIWAIGILSPVVLLPGRLFSGPDHAPTLEGQYVLKDIILLTASLVIATNVRRNTKAGEPTGEQTARSSLEQHPESSVVAPVHDELSPPEGALEEDVPVTADR